MRPRRPWQISRCAPLNLFDESPALGPGSLPGSLEPTERGSRAGHGGGPAAATAGSPPPRRRGGAAAPPGSSPNSRRARRWRSRSQHWSRDSSTERSRACSSSLGSLPSATCAAELVLGLDQLVDVAQDLLVIHESHRTGNRGRHRPRAGPLAWPGAGSSLPHHRGLGRHRRGHRPGRGPGRVPGGAQRPQARPAAGPGRGSRRPVAGPGGGLRRVRLGSAARPGQRGTRHAGPARRGLRQRGLVRADLVPGPGRPAPGEWHGLVAANVLGPRADGPRRAAGAGPVRRASPAHRVGGRARDPAREPVLGHQVGGERAGAPASAPSAWAPGSGSP